MTAIVDIIGREISIAAAIPLQSVAGGRLDGTRRGAVRRLHRGA